jgi:hypothetical protein
MQLQSDDGPGQLTDQGVEQPSDQSERLKVDAKKVFFLIGQSLNI